MQIKSFKAPTLKEAMANVKAELGVDAVILHTSKTKKGGILGFHSKEIVEVVAAVEDEPVKNAAAADTSTEAVLQAAAAARGSRTAEKEAVRDEAARGGSASGGTAASFLPKNMVNQYQTAGTMTAISQAIAKNTPSQTFGEVLSSVNKQQELPAATASEAGQAAEDILPEPSAADGGPAEAQAAPMAGGVSSPEQPLAQDRDEEIQELQNQLEEMKSLLLEMSSSKDGRNEVPTLRSALQQQEVGSHVIDDMIAKLNGSEILAPQNSVKAVKALEKYVRKSVRIANGITLYSDKPKVVALIGPTGVGKTTTLAKIAAKFVLEQGARVALITADTYRISAVEQLKTYSDILGLPLEIVYNPEALKQAIAKHQDKQLILLDTAGRSQYNSYQMQELHELLQIDEDIETHLVMSATTKTSDGIELMENFSLCSPDRVIFTKVDETSSHGIILNILHRRKAALSYLTNGQSVPDDIEPASVEKVAELLLR